jgi:hypothetical protein
VCFPGRDTPPLRAKRGLVPTLGLQHLKTFFARGVVWEAPPLFAGTEPDTAASAQLMTHRYRAGRLWSLQLGKRSRGKESTQVSVSVACRAAPQPPYFTIERYANPTAPSRQYIATIIVPATPPLVAADMVEHRFDNVRRDVDFGDADLKCLSRFFLSSAALANRLVRDIRSYLFVFCSGRAPCTGRSE